MPLKKQIKYLKYHFELEKYMKNMNKWKHIFTLFK
jgi:hypothetical protein